jgi:hypothetical protein
MNQLLIDCNWAGQQIAGVLPGLTMPGQLLSLLISLALPAKCNKTNLLVCIADYFS